MFLRNKEPVFVEESQASNRLFWTLVVLLVIAVFASIVIFGGHRSLPFWN
jgi:preprotein translocase subunit SecY